MANEVNKFVTEKVEKIVSNIKATNTDPMVSYNKFISTPINKLNFKPVSLYRINQIISKINSGNSFSHDLITGNIFKNVNWQSLHLSETLQTMLLKKCFS